MSTQRRNFAKAISAAGLQGLLGGTSMATMQTTLHVPPEESAHELTFMQWPVDRTVHRDKRFLRQLQQTIADIANAIAAFEPVVLLAARAHHAAARKLLTANVDIWDIATNDLWCRDSGPLLANTSSGEQVISHIQFNGWGKKQVHDHDGSIAENLASRLGIRVVPSGLTGEAGGVDHDGHGLLIAHESSWVNENRNPGASRDAIELMLLTAYGADQMIWAPGVRNQDITDYHIDSLARLTGPGRVLINLPEHPDRRDPFHRAALKTAKAMKDAGLAVGVIPEPVDRRVRSDDFVASYANYYACNGAIIAPQFGDRRTDEIAQQALQRHYPSREIVTLNVDALGEVGGGIHCATQQMPQT